MQPLGALVLEIPVHTISHKQDTTCIVPKYRAKNTGLSTHTQLTACNSIIPPMIQSFHRYYPHHNTFVLWRGVKNRLTLSHLNTFFVLKMLFWVR